MNLYMCYHSYHNAIHKGQLKYQILSFDVEGGRGIQNLGLAIATNIEN